MRTRIFRLASTEAASIYTAKLIENGVSFSVTCKTSGIDVTVPVDLSLDLWPKSTEAA